MPHENDNVAGERVETKGLKNHKFEYILNISYRQAEEEYTGKGVADTAKKAREPHRAPTCPPLEPGRKRLEGPFDKPIVNLIKDHLTSPLNSDARIQR